MTTPLRLGRTAGLLLVAGLLLGASNLTGKAITDIHMVEGKWRGQLKLADGPCERSAIR